MRAVAARGEHAEDAAARVELIDAYRRIRIDGGYSLRAVARALQVWKTTPADFERSTSVNPLVSTLARYGEVIGIKPVLTLEGVEARVPPAVEALKVCGYVGAAMLTQLIAAREFLGLSVLQVTDDAGMTKKALWLVERDDHEPQLGTLQRYARGLGGRLDARWEAL